MKILFIATPTPRQGNRGQFEAGQTHDLDAASARHWLSRGVAVVAIAKPAPDKPAPAKVEPPSVAAPPPPAPPVAPSDKSQPKPPIGAKPQ